MLMMRKAATDTTRVPSACETEAVNSAQGMTSSIATTVADRNAR
jgi:hypothetical protein